MDPEKFLIGSQFQPSENIDHSLWDEGGERQREGGTSGAGGAAGVSRSLEGGQTPGGAA